MPLEKIYSSRSPRPPGWISALPPAHLPYTSQSRRPAPP